MYSSSEDGPWPRTPIVRLDQTAQAIIDLEKKTEYLELNVYLSDIVDRVFVECEIPDFQSGDSTLNKRMYQSLQRCQRNQPAEAFVVQNLERCLHQSPEGGKCSIILVKRLGVLGVLFQQENEVCGRRGGGLCPVAIG